MFTKDGIRILANIAIVDPMRADLFPRSCAIQGFVGYDVTQAKEKHYCNQHPINQFLPLIIEVFSCLHKHADVLLHNCANAIWSLKRSKVPHLFILVTFFCQKIQSHYKKCKHLPS